MKKKEADIVAREDVRNVIHCFYSDAMKDELIGHFFKDVIQLDLETHLPRIVDFWESVLFGVGKYQGNPVLKHVHLNQLSVLKQEHFDRWLEIWSKTINDRYSGEKATEAINKAKMMADLMLYKIAASEGDGFVL